MAEDQKPTQERLLTCACEIFAEKGFRNATIAEISEAAGANIAAVNYHFGDKVSLYNACWRHAFKVALSAFPLRGDLADDALPELRLKAFIRAFVFRIFSDEEASVFPRIMVKEMAEPTEALGAIMNEVVAPQKQMLTDIIRELLGPDASEMDLRACGFSVISQCVFFAFNRVMREQHFEGMPNRDVHVEKLVEHIWQFSLSGIQGVKQKAEM
jgi:AcrR family transcriptional regulator